MSDLDLTMDDLEKLKYELAEKRARAKQDQQQRVERSLADAANQLQNLGVRGQTMGTYGYDYDLLRKYAQLYAPQTAGGSFGGLSAASAAAKAKPKAKPKSEKPKVTFDSVIAPEEDKKAVLEAIDQVKNHELIFDKWGFGEVFEKGTAISMLFYGIPGTGKTLMAQAIADKLGKKLKFVSTADIESSEPGGAERAIKQFFEQTKPDTILLFDEADSLVYDRQAVGSIMAAQVNQLLSSLEKYTGIVIFTTNQLGVLDEAFNRRLSLKLEFKMPNFEQRKAIWQRMFPKKAPLDADIDWDILAGFEITGGYIKNAVLRAARTAASEDAGKKKKTIKQRHIASALRSEILSKQEFEDAKVNKPRLARGGMQMARGIERVKDMSKGNV